jgi:hypothetical protein
MDLDFVKIGASRLLKRSASTKKVEIQAKVEIKRI